MVKQNNYKQFLIDMGWDEPKYGWTKEKTRVKKLLREQKKEMEGIVQNEYHNGFEDGFEEAEKRTEGVFKKMGLDEKFMEFLEDTGVKFITTKGNRKIKQKHAKL